MVDDAKKNAHARVGAPQSPRAERLPWTAPTIESAEVSQETAATNLKVVNESVNSLS